MFCSEDKLKQSKRIKVRRVFSFVEDLIRFWYFSLWNEAPKFCMLERDVTLFLCTNYRQLVINWLLLVINWLLLNQTVMTKKVYWTARMRTFHFRLPFASQNVGCLSSLLSVADPLQTSPQLALLRAPYFSRGQNKSAHWLANDELLFVGKNIHDPGYYC